MTANDGNEMAVFCSCGCKAGVVLKAEDWNADDGSVSLSLVSDEFYTEQATWRERLAEKCRRL